MPRTRWWSIVCCFVMVCADAATSAPPSKPPAPLPPPVRVVEPARKLEAARILRAYADRHALGEDRYEATPEELAAASLADPIDPSTQPDHWQQLDATSRLIEVFTQGQRKAWFAACTAGVAHWWQGARRIDAELDARLEKQPPPADFYAGMAFWRSQVAWLVARREQDPAVLALPDLVSVGAGFRLITAQNRWAQTWLDRDRPLEHAVGTSMVPSNAWAIEDLPTEQARFCAASYSDGLRRFPLPAGVLLIKPAVRSPSTPALESGTVAQVRKRGTEWVVNRRDWQTIIKSVPPCKRVRCTGIDCAMDERHGWRDVCAEKTIRRFQDHTFVLHFDAAPVTPHLGDVVEFYQDDSTGHAVLLSAARRASVPRYFALYP